MIYQGLYLALLTFALVQTAPPSDMTVEVEWNSSSVRPGRSLGFLTSLGPILDTANFIRRFVKDQVREYLVAEKEYEDRLYELRRGKRTDDIETTTNGINLEQEKFTTEPTNLGMDNTTPVVSMNEIEILF